MFKKSYFSRRLNRDIFIFYYYYLVAYKDYGSFEKIQNFSSISPILCLLGQTTQGHGLKYQFKYTSNQNYGTFSEIIDILQSCFFSKFFSNKQISSLTLTEYLAKIYFRLIYLHFEESDQPEPWTGSHYPEGTGEC